jgi:hypothetical protein
VPREQIELTGNVRHANGRPAARATVFAKAGELKPIYFENGQLARFTDYDGPKLGDPEIVTVKTNDVGEFRVRVTPPLFTLFVMHESGTQVVTHDQYIPEISISLDAWATISGEVRMPKVPTSEHSILMHSGHFPGTDGPYLLWHGEMRTDSKGRFVIDRVPANFEGGIRRVAQTTHGRSTWGFGAGFVTSPGEQYELNLGGRAVVGQLVLPSKRDDLFIQASIHRERLLLPPYPEGHESLSAADQWAWERSWWQSDEGKESTRRSHEGVFLQVDDEGRFRVEDVPSDVPLELDMELQPRESNWFGDLIRRIRRRPKELKLRREVLIPSASDPHDVGLLHAQ